MMPSGGGMVAVHLLMEEAVVMRTMLEVEVEQMQVWGFIQAMEIQVYQQAIGPMLGIKSMQDLQIQLAQGEGEVVTLTENIM